MKIYNSFSELIGSTPLVRLNKIEKNHSAKASIFAKLESFNPAGSAKDRIAREMIDDAEKKGIIKKGATLIEPTSGNTGIGLAAIAAERGYKAIFTMPDTMSIERINLLKAYGAKIVLTEGAKGMNGAIEKAKELAEEIDRSLIPSQFENISNPTAHYKTTGPEIWNDLDGKVDMFIVGVGTGGTISGAGKYLKEKNPDVKIIAVEPDTSPVLSKGKSGVHGIQGIGAGFVPATLDINVYDEVMTVSVDNAYKLGREIARSEGILVGISSGAALYAAVETSLKKENENKNIVVLLTDGGEKYLSTPMFEE